MKNTRLITGSTIIGITILIAVAFRGFAQSSPTPEQLREQAQIAMENARKSDCEALGTRIAACYKGDRGACNKELQENVQFAKNYGMPPELSCTSSGATFRFGETGR